MKNRNKHRLRVGAGTHKLRGHGPTSVHIADAHELGVILALRVEESAKRLGIDYRRALRIVKAEVGAVADVVLCELLHQTTRKMMSFDHTRSLRSKPTYRRLMSIAGDVKNNDVKSTIGDQEALGLVVNVGETVSQTLLRALDLAIERDTRTPNYPSPRD